MKDETRPPQPGPEVKHGVDHRLADTASGSAFERLCDALRSAGKAVRTTGPGSAMARCPAHDDRTASLAIWRKPGKVKIKCFAGCDDGLDVLPALGLSVRDLYDRPGSQRSAGSRQDRAIQARILARRSMDPVQRALDDLLQLPDIGMRLCLCIAAQSGRRGDDD